MKHRALRFVSLLLTLCVVLTLMPTIANAETAAPSKTNFVMNGKPVSVTAAYSINGSNYLQLRAIAVMLNGTSAQFDVGWDGQYAVIEPGKPYSGTITETKLQNTSNVKPSTTKFKMNGNVFTFSDAKLIDGSTNYIQLREFAQKLSGTKSQFNVYWDGAKGEAVIQPGVAYTGNAPQSSTTPTAKGGSARTINLDGLLTLEISNTHAYARLLAYDVSGGNIVHNIVVSEGATVKCIKYVPPYDNEIWEKALYTIQPYNSIYFTSGALWPEVKHAVDYAEAEKEGLAQGGSITLVNGREYSFEASTSDKAITSKYGKVGTVFYVVRIFVVPSDIAAKIGGSAPKMGDPKVTLQEYKVPPGSSSPISYITNPDSTLFSQYGWYELSLDQDDGLWPVELDSKGNAQIGLSIPVYVENKGTNQITLRLEDGRYLGIDGTAASGSRMKAVKNPYSWNVYFENNAGYGGNRYSLRPSTNTGLVLSASGTLKKGTPITLTAQKSMDAPKNAEFSFYPTNAPGLVAFTYTSDELKDDGIYYIKAAKDPSYAFDVFNNSKQDDAKFIINTNEGIDSQKFRITRVKDNQYTIQNVNSGKWLMSSGTKGAVLTQSGTVTDKSAITYTITKKADGTYRIMDSTGLFVGIAGGTMYDFTNVILDTEASDKSQAYIFQRFK